MTAHLNAALAYVARQGWRVLPLHTVTDGACSCGKPDCHSPGKHPRTRHGVADATSDEATVRAWWEEAPEASIGLATGSAFVVLDIDPRNAGDRTLDTLIHVHGALPPTLECATGGGGRHLFFAVAEPTKSKKLGDGLDFQGLGKYVVAAPSLHASGKAYTWANDLPMAPLPEWIRELSAVKPIIQDAPTSGLSVSDSDRHRRAAAYLRTMDPAISGAHGHDALFRAAVALVRGFDIQPSEALSMLATDYNPRCQPPWSRREIEHKVKQASTSSTLPIGYLLTASPPRSSPPGIGLPAEQRDDVALPAAAIGALMAEVDSRPVVAVRKGMGHQAVAEALSAMRADPGLYQRQRSLVFVAGASDAEDGIAVGTPVIREMGPATLWERTSRAIRWVTHDDRKGCDVPTNPPKDVLAALLARGDYPGIRPIAGVIESPTLRPDGGLVFGHGYDAPTRFLCCPSENFMPPVPEPTQADAAAALAEIRHVFAEFEHVSEADRMVPVALVLTLLARPAIVGPTPCFVFDSSTRGGGKTLQADTAALIATGRIPPPENYPEAEDELEKRLGSIAISAPAFIKWDNLSGGKFGAAPIDGVVTAQDTYAFRILGQTARVELPWRTVMATTGNNVQLCGDMSRRAIVCRVVPSVENPESLSHTHEDLLGWCRAERVRLVRAGLTILRAWYVAGRPALCPSWRGGFERWSEVIPNAIAYAGGADVLACRASTKGEEEPEKVALGLVLEGLARMDPNGRGLTSREILELLYPRDRLRGEAGPDGYEAMREGVEQLVTTRQGLMPNVKAFGEKLRFHGADRVIKGRRLRKHGGHNNVTRWVSSIVTSTDGGTSGGPGEPHA
jgi:hypothetical protein